MSRSRSRGASHSQQIEGSARAASSLSSPTPTASLAPGTMDGDRPGLPNLVRDLRKLRNYYMGPAVDAFESIVTEEVCQPGWLDRLARTALTREGVRTFAARLHERAAATPLPHIALEQVAEQKKRDPRPMRLTPSGPLLGDTSKSNARAEALLLLLLASLPGAYSGDASSGRSVAAVFSSLRSSARRVLASPLLSPARSTTTDALARLRRADHTPDAQADDSDSAGAAAAVPRSAPGIETDEEDDEEQTQSDTSDDDDETSSPGSDEDTDSDGAGLGNSALRKARAIRRRTRASRKKLAPKEAAAMQRLQRTTRNIRNRVARSGAAGDKYSRAAATRAGTADGEEDEDEVEDEVEDGGDPGQSSGSSGPTSDSGSAGAVSFHGLLTTVNASLVAVPSLHGKQRRRGCSFAAPHCEAPPAASAFFLGLDVVPAPQHPAGPSQSTLAGQAWSSSSSSAASAAAAAAASEHSRHPPLPTDPTALAAASPAEMVAYLDGLPALDLRHALQYGALFGLSARLSEQLFDEARSRGLAVALQEGRCSADEWRRRAAAALLARSRDLSLPDAERVRAGAAVMSVAGVAEEAARMRERAEAPSAAARDKAIATVFKEAVEARARTMREGEEQALKERVPEVAARVAALLRDAVPEDQRELLAVAAAREAAISERQRRARTARADREASRSEAAAVSPWLDEACVFSARVAEAAGRSLKRALSSAAAPAPAWQGAAPQAERPDYSVDGVAAAAGAQPSAAEHGMLCALCFDPLLQAVFAQRPAALCPTSIRTALRFGGLWGPRSVSLLFALFEMAGSINPMCLPAGALSHALLAIEPSRQRPPKAEALVSVRSELKQGLEALFRFAAVEKASPPGAPDALQLLEQADAGVQALPEAVNVAFGAPSPRAKRRRSGGEASDDDDDESLLDGGWPAFLGPKRPRSDAAAIASLPALLDGKLPDSLLAIVRRAASAATRDGATTGSQGDAGTASDVPPPSAAAAAAAGSEAAAARPREPTAADSTRRAIEAGVASHIDLLAVPWPPATSPGAASDVTATTVLPRHLVCTIPPATKRTARMAAKQALHPHAVLARLPEEVLRWRARLRVNDDVVYHHHSGAIEAELGKHTVRSIRACARRPQWLQRMGKDTRTGASQRAAAAAPRTLAAAAADSEPDTAARSLAPLEALAAEAAEATMGTGAAAEGGGAEKAGSGSGGSGAGAGDAGGDDSGVAGVWLSEAKRAAAKEEAHDELVLAGRGVARRPIVTLDQVMAAAAAAREAAGEAASSFPAPTLRYGIVFLVDWLDEELQQSVSESDSAAVAAARTQAEDADARLAVALAAEEDAIEAAEAAVTGRSGRLRARGRRAVKSEPGADPSPDPAAGATAHAAAQTAAAMSRARGEAEAATLAAQEKLAEAEARCQPTQTWLDWGTLSVVAPLQLNMYLFDSIKDGELPDGAAAVVAPPRNGDVEVPEAITSPAAVVRQYLGEDH
ncbi:hypothetical protein FNF31_06827 [Cafeteria roenbergensis]|uniref:Uncharacterized protein n=2 Tax=Cafeteria roenbergensis TaxID=33653 RepID=A0A5A8CED0_CAFRO|nr:hypothetical protein FNF31_06827 [Cafeteria roenbergensis]